jgi:hypothetical protein
VVPPAARANYAHTLISLASFLNWRLFDPARDAEATLSWDGMRSLIGTAKIWDAFETKGYRVLSFSTTFPATRSIANVDVELRPPHQVGRFGATWRVNSPLASLPLRCSAGLCGGVNARPYPMESIADLEWKLATLRSLPDSAGPILAFMHLLVPHEPYLFDAGCAPGIPWWPLSDQGPDFSRIGQKYAIQVGCLDRMLLETMRELLRKPGPRPVIILQADHGHGRITTDPLRGFSLTAAELSPEQVGERLGVFAAYLFPGADTTVYDDITAVNVMPLVLQSIFGTVAHRQADRAVWSTYQDPFTFTEIAPDMTTPPARKGAEAALTTLP